MRTQTIVISSVWSATSRTLQLKWVDTDVIVIVIAIGSRLNQWQRGVRGMASRGLLKRVTPECSMAFGLAAIEFTIQRFRALGTGWLIGISPPPSRSVQPIIWIIS